MQQTPVFVSFFIDASRKNSDGTCLIKMNVYQKLNKRRYGTKFHITKIDWEKLNAPKLKDEELKALERQLNALKTSAGKIIENIVPFSFVAFEELFFGKPQNASVKCQAVKSTMLTDWFENAISVLEANDQIGTASTYRTTMNSINSFKNSLLLQDINLAFLLSYETQLLSESKSLTTINIYMRNLRAIINDAIETKVISRDNYPFKEYEIPTGQNIKKALNNADINKILNHRPKRLDHQKAIDYWIFSYLCNGMNFADIISLKPQNISGRFLSFYRQKTIRTKKKDLRPIKVALNQRALIIMDRWKNTDPNSSYLFPILEAGLSAKIIKNRCQRFIKWVNKRMYEISEELEIEGKTTTYAARHTFSTVLKRKGVPISYIRRLA